MRLRIAFVVAFALLVSVVPTALAHAVAGRTDPVAGARLGAGPAQVTIDFTETIDRHTTTIEVFDNAHAHVDQGPVRYEGDRRAAVDVRPGLPAGGYLVRWSTVSAVDGHPTSGSFAFVVGDGPVPHADAITSPPPRLDAIVGKSFIFVGLAAATGFIGALLWFAVDASPPLSRRFRDLGLAGAALHLLGLATLGLAQADAGGRGFGSYLADTAYGHGLVLRAVLGLLLAGAFLLPRGARWTLVVASGAAVVATAAFSHTAARFHPYAVGVALDAIHLATVFAWAGGLVPLGILLFAKVKGRQASDRFSRLATVCVVLLGVTGLVMTASVFGWNPRDWVGALGTPYATVLAVKVGLAVLMIAMGGASRWVHLAAVRRGETVATRRAFARNVAREAAVGLVVFLLAGGLTNLSPATDTTVAVQGFQRDGIGDTYAVRLTLDPEPQAQVTSVVRARVTELSNGHAVDNASRVRFTFTPPDASLGSSDVLAKHTADGVYEATGAFFPIAGRWNLTVTLQTPEVYLDEVPFSFQVA